MRVVGIGMGPILPIIALQSVIAHIVGSSSLELFPNLKHNSSSNNIYSNTNNNNNYTHFSRDNNLSDNYTTFNSSANSDYISKHYYSNNNNNSSRSTREDEQGITTPLPVSIVPLLHSQEEGSRDQREETTSNTFLKGSPNPIRKLRFGRLSKDDKVSVLPPSPDVLERERRLNPDEELDSNTRKSRADFPATPPVYQVVQTTSANNNTAHVDGLRIEAVEKGVSYEGHGVSIILADVQSTVRLFGYNFTNHTVIRFATELKARGDDCDDTSSTKTYALSEISENAFSAVLNVVFPTSQLDEYYFLCVRENDKDMPWIHQGPDPWLRVKAYARVLPFWVQAILIGVLLLLSGLFAGLTLGLLALDRTDLKILANTGSEKERNYAKTILPLRTRGNYLLCSLVLGNVLVNSTLTILLDDLTTGVFAVMLSTAGIVVVGEIIPQAVCSRNGLAIGAKTVWVTKFIMIITFPLSYTFSVMLDKILGEEIGIVYNREKLKELIAVTMEHNQLETDEINIISGALEMRKKTVEAIMTRLEDVFMLPLERILDFETLSEIRKQGYSRIPIYENERPNIVSLLFTKDLLFVDPDDRIPLRTLAEFYKNTCYFIFSDTTLDIVFKEFKECKRGGHMAFVQRVNTSREDKDPYCETIGLVTLEDVIEEMIQSEIVDETDVWMDNRSKKRMPIHQKQDFSKFVEIRNSQKTICISPQLALAAFQFLSTVVEPFKSHFISESVLHRLLKKNILFRIPKSRDSAKANLLIYENGKPTDAFTIVLEGRVEVITGQENLMFETGPFAYFGVPALLLTGDATFTPDYTVRQTTDLIVLRIRRSLYHAAIQATILENAKTTVGSNGSESQVDPSIEEQIERVLRTVDTEVQMHHTPDMIPSHEAEMLNSLSHIHLPDDNNI